MVSQRARLRGEWKVRHQRRQGSNQVGGRETKNRQEAPGFLHRRPCSYMQLQYLALNPTQMMERGTLPPPQKGCPRRENNRNGVTTEGKLKFASGVALPAAPALLPTGTDTALPGEALSVHCLKGWARLGSSWESGNCSFQHLRSESCLHSQPSPRRRVPTLQ